ncbi:MAG: amino acid adenylation domain-containing protein [Flavobacteriales bacterium]|nr:amino acid adenylation domain-containing protein [Flavobacteriales bacterium]
MRIAYEYNLGLYFNRIAEENAKKVAVRAVEGEETLYREIGELSNKIALYLLKQGVRRNDVVAIFNDKTALSYAMMIGCLKIGVAYSNLDPKSPIERFERMIATCDPSVFFYSSNEHTIPEEFDSKAITVVDYSSSVFSKSLDEFSGALLPDYTNEVTGNTPAYIMFTSGSTGFPKGVVISHQNVLNFIGWSQKTYEITSKDVFTNLNPMHFDNSVFDFYSSLFTGAAIVPVSEKLTINPRRLIDALNVVNPTVWFSVPSMLVYVLNMRAIKESDLMSLRVVTYGGEGFPKNQLRKLWKFWGERVRFVNVYGPTECTCICSSYDVSEKDMDSDELLPLGHMAPNFYGIVLDEVGKEVSLGEIGELAIGGPNVGIGYYKNPEKTAEVFVSDPSVLSHTQMVYKSGDLVKQDPETKMYMFCGRKDNQIKRMGYRIELEEIENAFNAIGFVKEAAVIYLDNDKFSSKIIACLSSQEKEQDKVSEVLKKYLPSYMLPDLYFYFEHLPKNQNGKIDRLKLKEHLTK